MENKINVLIVDDNQNLIERVKQYFRNHAVINIISEAHDGKEGLDIILKEQNFNLILLDLVMPNKDGIYLLEELKKRNQNFDIIVISGLGEEEVIRKTCSYGVKYFILKPFDIKDLEKRILDFIYYKEKFDIDKLNMECILIKLLHSLGIPSHIKGYQYLKDGIYLLYSDPNLSNHIMKNLYPKIALKYNTTVKCVEKSIRHALEIGWDRGDYKLMEEIFGHSINFNKTKPTNLEFMVTIVDKLRIDMAKIK